MTQSLDVDGANGTTDDGRLGEKRGNGRMRDSGNVDGNADKNRIECGDDAVLVFDFKSEAPLNPYV